MADRKPEAPHEAGNRDAPSPSPAEPSLGKLIAAARERKGLSQSQAAADSHLPAHYLKMIENDDYSSIADQLYLLPFLRRYASFVGMDPEEIASRFVRDVQHADMNATRMSEPIAMIERGRRSPLRNVIMLTLVAVIVVLGWFAFREYSERHSARVQSALPIVVAPPAIPAAPAPVASAVAAAPAPPPAQAAPLGPSRRAVPPSPPRPAERD